MRVFPLARVVDSGPWLVLSLRLRAYVLLRVTDAGGRQPGRTSPARTGCKWHAVEAVGAAAVGVPFAFAPSALGRVCPVSGHHQSFTGERHAGGCLAGLLLLIPIFGRSRSHRAFESFETLDDRA
eukprot:CAMPEP_0118999060 /NCGR_PEP_ID=MMETSP1173-20130426/63390_1 /TAXON_ID=1034831 /ORGANISM="Rhizochromulina marina cf, Strain CCMP1243" /LENGTH=124 /DNA_ID=CAMNT_0006950561 /DNA_START=390 /DNA_END=764 /DNA_ORIENTATION=+